MSVLLSALATAALGETSHWGDYRRFDSPASHNWDPIKHTTGDYTMQTEYPVGPPPLDCLDVCFDDPQCYGLVLWQGVCYFRGGKGNEPHALFDRKVPRDDMALYIIYGAHPFEPNVGKMRLGALILLIAVGSLIMFLCGYCGHHGIKSGKIRLCSRKEHPILMPHNHREGDLSRFSKARGCEGRGCDLGCLSTRKVPPLV